MPTKTISLPHPDTRDATIQIHWDDGEIFVNMFIKAYDTIGKEYRSDVDFDKEQLAELIKILTEAYEGMCDD